MSKISEIIESARQRGQTRNLPYAGCLSPVEAHALLIVDPEVMLIDVRTNAERDWVGTVDIPDDQDIPIQWNLYPVGTQNPDFITQLGHSATKEKILLFLCRSGVRSRSAAKLATENGYSQCFDILEGFEGDKDANGHRKTVGGWCKAGLPWNGA